MRPYGLWGWVVEGPDVGDCKEMGTASHNGHLKLKSGEYRSWFKSSRKKKRIRRYWKRLERKNNKITDNGD